MSELISTDENGNAIRWRLLSGVSALALMSYVSATSIARAENADRPQLWIELGGQLAWNMNSQENFLPPFVLTMPRPPFDMVSPQTVERQAPTSWDESGKISFQPPGTEWVFSAGVRYGRSGRHQFLDQLTQATRTRGGHNAQDAYQDITASSSESHAILDFQVGKDVGLGTGVSSIISLGVRYAQFHTRASASIRSQPSNVNYEVGTYTRYNASFDAKRSFTGVGPSLSWDASAAMLGNTADGEIAVDWGVNAAVLFGRQKVRGLHQTTAVGYNTYYGYPTNIRHHTGPLDRSRRVIVPNVGGFAALSWRYDNAKVSFGYRADFFFGAMDTGIDARRTSDVGFHGPFATISIGLGG